LIVGKNTVVSLDVVLSDIWGNALEQSGEPVQYLHGAHGDIFPAVESALEGRARKDHVEVRLEPEDAFGEYNEALLRVVPLDLLPEALEVGLRFEGRNEDTGQSVFFTVTDIAEGKAVLDGNHPLAGIALQVSCTVVGIRAATEAEISNGSADDPSSVIVRALP
jgi:FKBP-type peptidyl-prolyl cis-trans isomerase SlyD